MQQRNVRPSIDASLNDDPTVSSAEPAGLMGTVHHLAKNVLTMLVTGYIIMASDALGVMYSSRKIYRNVLYASLFCHSILCLIGFYLTFIVARYEPNWELTHMKFIYVATASVVTGSLLWMIAVWPVFHLWTFPIGIAFLFFVFSFISLIPGGKKKKAD